MGTLKGEVLNILKEKGPISISQIAKALSKNKQLLSGYLQGLADSGILKEKRVGKAKVFLIDGNRTTIQRFPVNTERKQGKIEEGE